MAGHIDRLAGMQRAAASGEPRLDHEHELAALSRL